MRTITASEMRVILERVFQAQTELRARPHYDSYTCLDLPLEWLMRAAVSPVAVEPVELKEAA
jgi:hypothetical protein